MVRTEELTFEKFSILMKNRKDTSHVLGEFRASCKDECGIMSKQITFHVF